MIVHNYNFHISISNKLNDNEIINAYSYENLVKRFLEYCEIINMDVVKNDGHIFECPIQGFEESSIANTGFFILTTSHLAWHTFPEKNYISFQLSTCGDKKDEVDLKNLLREILIGVNFII